MRQAPLVLGHSGGLAGSNNFQVGMFYGIGSDFEKSAKKTDIEKSDGNNLMPSAKAPKVLTIMTIGTGSMIKFHGKHFYGKFPTV